MNRNDLIAPPTTPKQASASPTMSASPHHHATTTKPVPTFTSPGGSSCSSINNNGSTSGIKEVNASSISPHGSNSSGSKNNSSLHSFQTPKRTKSGCSIKSAALLEETSVHLSLPSFHTRNFQNAKGGWKCAGCSYENHSTLNNECSVCGMMRNISYHTHNDTQNDSFSDDSVSTFMNDSCNSLSLDNSFSITDDGAVLLSKEEIGSVIGGGGGAKGHASMPAAAFHNSFSSHSGHSGDRSVRSTRTYRGGRRPPRRAADRQQQQQDYDASSSLNDSVMSFCHWNGNEQIKPWSCTVCTFVNENPLHLVCEMCGQRRVADDAAAAAGPTVIPADSNSSHDADYCFTGTMVSTSDEEDAAELYWLQQEQMRELVELQREIMADFGTRPPSPRRRTAPRTPTRTPTRRRQQQQQSRFNTRDLQRELDQIGGLSSPRTAAATIIDSSDHSSEDGASSEDRLKELLATQKDIMLDFKRKREDPDSYSSPIPDKKAASRPMAPTPSSATAAAATTHRLPESMIGSHNAHCSLGGASTLTAAPTNTSIQNTAPAAAVSLKDSMKAAGGKLRHEDLCLPFLWGDTSWYDNANNTAKGGGAENSSGTPGKRGGGSNGKRR